MKYHIYVSQNEDGIIIEQMAISELELQESKPSDFFPPSHDNIFKKGEIMIEGDTDLLFGWLSVM